MRLPRPQALRAVGLVLVVLSKLADSAVSVWVLGTITPLGGREGWLATTYEIGGPTLVLALTLFALVVLIAVVEFGAWWTGRLGSEVDRRKNLQAVYVVGYWLPGVVWLYRSIHHGWFMWTVVGA